MLVFQSGEPNGGLPEGKIRGDPKARTQRPLLTRVEDALALEVRQEGVHVYVRQLLGQVGLVRRFKRAVGKTGVQL